MDSHRRHIETALTEFVASSDSESGSFASAIKRGSIRLGHIEPRSLELRLALAKQIRPEDFVADGGPLVLVAKAACHALAALVVPNAKIEEISTNLQLFHAPAIGAIWVEAVTLTAAPHHIQCSVDIIDSTDRRVAAANCEVALAVAQ